MNKLSANDTTENNCGEVKIEKTEELLKTDPFKQEVTEMIDLLSTKAENCFSSSSHLKTNVMKSSNVSSYSTKSSNVLSSRTEASNVSSCSAKASNVSSCSTKSSNVPSSRTEASNVSSFSAKSSNVSSCSTKSSNVPSSRTEASNVSSFSAKSSNVSSYRAKSSDGSSYSSTMNQRILTNAPLCTIVDNALPFSENRKPHSEKCKSTVLNCFVKLENIATLDLIPNIKNEQGIQLHSSNPIYESHETNLYFKARLKSNFNPSSSSQALNINFASFCRSKNEEDLSDVFCNVVDTDQKPSFVHRKNSAEERKVTIKDCSVVIKRLQSSKLTSKIKSELYSNPYGGKSLVELKDIAYNEIDDTNQIFKEETLLTEKVNSSQEPNSLAIDFCDKQLETMAAILPVPEPAGSVKSWNGELFKCDLCSKEFIKKICLKYHIRIHSLYSSVEDQKEHIHCKLCAEDTNKVLNSDSVGNSDVLNYKNGLNSSDNHFSVLSHPETLQSESESSNLQLKKNPKAQDLVCNICDRIFEFKCRWEEHIEIHDESLFLQCSLCPFKVRRKDQLKNHLRSHTECLPFTCPLCPLKFKTKKLANIHSQTHGERHHQCPFCQFKFKRSQHLTLHLSKMHDKNKPYFCKFCPAKFKLKADFENHKKSHDETRPYQCQLCPSKFKTKVMLRQHEECHNKELAFHCQTCPSKFKAKVGLRQHVKQCHTKIKSYQCPTCPAKFKTSQALRQHTMRHSDNRPYQCPTCPYRAKNQGDLAKHVERHGESKQLQCPLCPAKLKHRDGLNSHIKTHNKSRPFECSYCPSKYKTKSSLTSHMQMHENYRRFKCPKCPLKFTKIEYLEDHVVVHNPNRNFTCQDCGASFKHRGNHTRHIKTHLGLKKPTSS